MARPIIPIFTQKTCATASASTPLRALPPLALYVHFPWCIQKCPYCDFNSHTAPPSIPEHDYLTALIADLEAALPSIWGRQVSTIFIGGGTPSLLSAAGVAQFLSDLRARLPLMPGAEITLEANPGSFEAQKFADFRAAGINRLSLGIQSFQPKHLKRLGRVHSATQAHQALAAAAQHFERFNLDLMYGLPGQSLADMHADLDAALRYAPPHLSYYQLTIEEHTAFAANPPELPEHDLCADMQEALEQKLADAGFTHYETSAFAKAPQLCAHNLNYWHFGDYLGIGAGAHSKLSFPERIVRQMRWKSPARYLIGAPFIQEEFTVSDTHKAFEFMMNALRLTEGFSRQLFSERTGLSLNTIAPAVRKAQAEGLLYDDGHNIRPTLRGQRYLNRLLAYFLTE